MTWGYQTDSLWLSPVILIWKNGDLRFCMHYRKLNNVMNRDCFPPPRTDNRHAGWSQIVLHSGPEEQIVAGGSASWQQGEDCILDGSRGMAVHTNFLWPLQCSSGIWEVNGDRLKRPHLQVMSHVLEWHDSDWLHIPRAPAEPEESVPAVPRRLPKAQFGDMQLFQKEVQYFGHTVSPEGIITDSNKLKAKWKWLTPKNKHEIKISWTFTHITEFISCFTNNVKPQPKLMEKQAFQCTPEVEAAFQTLKEAICTTPILAYPQLEERFVIDTDMSNRLLQLSCWTKLNEITVSPGRNYLQSWEHKNIKGQTAHWIQCLQEYNFTSKDHQGLKTMPIPILDGHAEKTVLTVTKSRCGQT